MPTLTILTLQPSPSFYSPNPPNASYPVLLWIALFTFHFTKFQTPSVMSHTIILLWHTKLWHVVACKIHLDFKDIKMWNYMHLRINDIWMTVLWEHHSFSLTQNLNRITEGEPLRSLTFDSYPHSFIIKVIPGNSVSGIVDSVINSICSQRDFQSVGSLTINQKLKYSVLSPMMTTVSKKVLSNQTQS